MATRTTDAVITMSDPVTGEIKGADPLDMASQAEADAAVAAYGAFGKVFIDDREALWAKKDSRPDWHPFLIHFDDGSTYRVSRMADQLADNPGSKFVPDGHGGITFVPKDYTEPAPIPHPGQNAFLGMDPAGFSNDTKAILARIDALDQKWSGQ